MRKGQKMPEELRIRRTEYMKSHPLRYWQGKKRGSPNEEWRKKLSEGQKLAYKEGRRKVSNNSINNVKKLNKGKFGRKHPKWTENKKRPFYGAIRSLNQYKNWRKSIFEKDNYTCQKCGKQGGYIEADHYPVKFIEIVKKNNLFTIEDTINCSELWNAKGRTLCKKCHLNSHRLSKM